jgi:hypothetical protein
MAMHEPVTLEELGSSRPVAGFRSWIESLCARYKTPEFNQYFVARRGLTNKLQGELVPLAQFCHHIAHEHQDCQLKYFPTTGQSFDAQILSENGTVKEVIEVTLACDGYRDSIAGEYLNKYGWAPLWVPLSYSGRRNSRELPLPEMGSMDTEQIVEDGLTLIRNAVEAKSSSSKYKGVSLVVGLEDFRFLPRHTDGVKAELAKIPSAFAVIYYVGLEGRFFYAHHNQAQS